MSTTPQPNVPAVALVTAEVASGHDADLAVLRDAVAAAGARVAVCDWDDPGVHWPGFDVVVLRSPWDYVQRHDEFLAWIDATARVADVHNPPSLVRWNIDKHYLSDLARAGIGTVPTVVLDPGATAAAVESAVAECAAALPTGVVVKPTVSAGSKDTARHTSIDGAVSHANTLLGDGRSVLVQPYLRAVDDVGETGLVFFDGEFSHGFRKGAILKPDASPTDALFAPEHIAARTPSDDERALAERVCDFLAAFCAGEAPLYARIDLIPGADGAPVVLEVECAEPSFFFSTAADAATRFADAILARAGATKPIDDRGSR